MSTSLEQLRGGLDGKENAHIEFNKAKNAFNSDKLMQDPLA